MDKGLVTLIGMSIAYLASFAGLGLACDDECGERQDLDLAAIQRARVHKRTHQQNKTDHDQRVCIRQNEVWHDSV